MFFLIKFLGVSGFPPPSLPLKKPINVYMYTYITKNVWCAFDCLGLLKGMTQYKLPVCIPTIFMNALATVPSNINLGLHPNEMWAMSISYLFSPHLLYLGFWSDSIQVRMEALFSRATCTILANIELDSLDSLDAIEVCLYILIVGCFYILPNILSLRQHPLLGICFITAFLICHILLLNFF